MGIPFLDLGGGDATAPAADGAGDMLAAPANVDAQDVAEEVRGVLPLVALELPGLAGGEDGDEAAPVVRFELLRRVDEDEAQRALRVDAGQQARDVEDHGGGAGGAGEAAFGWDVGPGFEKGFDVRHAQEGGGGGGEQDYGVGAAGGLLGEGDKGCGV